MFSSSFDPGLVFGSEAINLEDSILSAILGNPSPPETETSPPSPAQHPYPSWSIDYTTSPTISTDYLSVLPEQHMAVRLSDANLPTSSNPATFISYQYSAAAATRSDDLTDQLNFQYSSPQSPIHPLQPRFPLDLRPRSPIPEYFNASSSDTDSLDNDIDRKKSCRSPLQNIHDRVTAPYDYTEGYHFLMKHLPTRYVY